MISAKQLKKCFAAWMKPCHEATNGEVIAIDGKTLRSTYDKGHGRIETRLSSVNYDLSILGDIEFDWPELTTMGIVASIRQEGDEAAESMPIRDYISSAKLTAKELLESTRAHWSIEVQLHWKLDVGMREDDCRIRRGDAGENLAGIRHIALNLLKADSYKAGIKRKRLKAGFSTKYLSQVIER